MESRRTPGGIAAVGVGLEAVMISSLAGGDYATRRRHPPGLVPATQDQRWSHSGTRTARLTGRSDGKAAGGAARECHLDIELMQNRHLPGRGLVLHSSAWRRRHFVSSPEGALTGEPMNTLGKTLLATACALSLSSSVQAEPLGSHDGVFLYYPDTGRMVMGQLDKQAMETSMKQTKPLNGPVVVILQGGKAYLVEDPLQKMADGQRMIDFLDRMTYGSR
jgi:hypothetical protein